MDSPNLKTPPDSATPLNSKPPSNSEKPFCNLPNEMVLHIVDITVEKYYISNYSMPAAASMQREKAKAIIAASHICKYWRDVLLGCNWIWGSILTIDTSPKKCIEEFLKRAKSAPLSIYSKPPGSMPQRRQDFSSPKWTLLLERVQQWKILDVTIHIGSYYPQEDHQPGIPYEVLLHSNSTSKIKPLIMALSRPAPLLESFRLDFRGADSVRMSVSRQRKFIPTMLFSGVTPRLRNFYFRDLVVDTMTNFRSTNKLTHLNIQSLGLTTTFSVEKWLDILGDQIQMVYIRLDGNLITDNTSGDEKHLHTVWLPTLRFFHLIFYHDIKTPPLLFSKLRIPPACDVKIHLTVKHPADSVTPRSTLKFLGSSWVQAGLKRFITDWKFFHNAGHTSTIERSQPH